MSGLEKVFAFELYLLNFESLRKRHRDTVEKNLKKNESHTLFTRLHFINFINYYLQQIV